MAYKTLADLPTESKTNPEAAPAYKSIPVGPRFPEGFTLPEPVEGRTLPPGLIPDSGFTMTLPDSLPDRGFITAPERPNFDPGFRPTSPDSTTLYPQNRPPLFDEGEIKSLTPEERVKDMLERGIESMTDEEFEAMLADEKFKEAFPQAYEYINSEDYEIMAKSLDNLQTHYAPSGAIEGQKDAMRQAVLGEMTKDLEAALEAGKETPEESNDTTPQDTTETPSFGSSELDAIKLPLIKVDIKSLMDQAKSPLDSLNLPDAMKEVISDHIEPSLPESKFEKARTEKLAERIHERESERASRGSEFNDIVQNRSDSLNNGIDFGD